MYSQFMMHGQKNIKLCRTVAYITGQATENRNQRSIHTILKAKTS